MDGEDWYDVRHGRLIISPNGTAKEGIHQTRLRPGGKRLTAKKSRPGLLHCGNRRIIINHLGCCSRVLRQSLAHSYLRVITINIWYDAVSGTIQ